MHLVICSKRDLAGQNIKEWLINFLDPDKRKLNDYTIYQADNIGIVEIEERLIFADYIDLKLKKLISFDEILFASRHSSKDKRKIFSVHVSGNVKTADFGGKPYSLARPSPITMKNYVLALKEKLERKPEFTFTLEVTHHGPSEIKTPSAFYEIGSTEVEWRDEEAARIVAESMIEAIDGREDWNIAVGVGGTHYAPRQTEIMLNTTFTFGHNFAKYTFEGLNEEILAKAIEISEADYIIIDEKSTTSKIKGLINQVAEKLNVEVLKSKEVKKKFSL
ncbi:D-tyrosyl-tRNA(Tyr) deacylase [Archaeoglobales archaeon]|nr:MAG: D-tyrosyl-tRNA(Tyr) deacylase [Archaeoglobales archaeon]